MLFMKACASLEPNYQPPVTFIVVQKRHHTRLFANNHRDRNSTDRSGNILPGMLNDLELVIHTNEFMSSLFLKNCLLWLIFSCFWYAFRNCCWYQNLSSNRVWFLSLQSRWHPGKKIAFSPFSISFVYRYMMIATRWIKGFNFCVDRLRGNANLF